MDLDLLLPDVIPLERKGEVYATLPGELPVVDMLRIEKLREEGAAHEEALMDLADTPENADARAAATQGVLHFYEQACAELQRHATMAVEGELLELTATQIIVLVSMLAAPPHRLEILANAFLMVMGVQVAEDGQEVPLADGSTGTSSTSGEPEAGRAPTGGRSRGASSSRSARKPSTVKK